MQVKPRFESFKILEQYSILKDDTGSEICLTLFEVMLPSNIYTFTESSYLFWEVVGKNQEQWNNKSVSYSNIAFWKKKQEHKYFNKTIKGFKIEEIEDGSHFLFGDYKDNESLRTKFIISRAINNN